MSNLTDADCQRISDRLIAHSTAGYRNNDGSYRTDNPNVEDDCQNLMRELLPSQASLSRFHEWSRTRCEVSRQLSPPVTATALIKTIEETDFLSEESRTTLCDMLSTDLRPYIGLGMHRNYHYCLRPDILQLVPEHDDVDMTDSRESLPGSILGINLINSSNGIDKTGFTFMQLGRVDHLANSDRARYESENLEPVEMHWGDSSFVLVVAIEHNGTTGAPWLLFNFKPESDIDGNRVDVLRGGRFWGTLLGDQTQRVAVKLGEKMSDLQDKKLWNMTRSYEKTYDSQIVIAVLVKTTSERSRILRQRVIEESCSN
jgi:hypothetical protein